MTQTPKPWRDCADCRFDHCEQDRECAYGLLPAAPTPSPEPPETPKLRLRISDRTMTRCQSDDDGWCEWDGCPQLRDGEPSRSSRHCPLDRDEGEPPLLIIKFTDAERKAFGSSSVSPGAGPTPGESGIMHSLPASQRDAYAKVVADATPSSTGTADDIAQFVEYWINEAAEQWPGSKLADRLPECIAFIRARRSLGANKRDQNWNVDAELVKAGAPAGDTERALRELREKVDNRLGVMLAEKSGLPESTHSHLCEMSRAVLAEFDASLRSAAPEGAETKP